MPQPSKSFEFRVARLAPRGLILHRPPVARCPYSQAELERLIEVANDHARRHRAWGAGQKP